MRTLLLYPWLPSADAGHGSAAVVAALLPELGRHAEVVLVCGHAPDERPLVQAVRRQVHALVAVERPEVRQLGVLPRAVESVATAAKVVRHGWPVPVVKQWRRGLVAALRSAAAAHAPQNLHIEIGLMAPYAAVLPHLPTTLVDHEVQEAAPMRRFAQQHYARCRELLVLCEHDAQLLEQSVQRRATVRPIALPAQAAPPRAPVPGRLLFVGSARHAPNHDALQFLLREVLPAARAAVPRAQLRVVGATAQEFGCAPSDALHFAGRVPDLAAEFATAALVLAPVASGGGVRVKNIEALQCGAALLTTPLGWRGLDHLPADSAAIADLPAFASRATELLRNPAACESLAARARNSVGALSNSAASAAITLAAWRRALA